MIRILGGVPLKGDVTVSGSKNAALPILIATLLSDGQCTIRRVPHLQDILTTLRLLTEIGVETDVDFHTHTVKLTAGSSMKQEAPYELVRAMRASILVLGPLLARYGRAKVALPGGCAIGSRPIGFHLSGLKLLGADIHIEEGYVVASAERLIGNRIVLDFPSVGATENLMMSAVLAKGQTLLENCAREPEIVDLACMLRSMGAKIQGEGTERIEIEGIESLGECKHEVMGDRIEAGTYLAAGLATGGTVTVKGIEPSCMDAVLAKLEKAGGTIQRDAGQVKLDARGRPRAIDVTTQPFPGFPTDMQAQMMAVLCVASGTSVVTETIFESRYMHVPELVRLGADITVQGKSAIVKGREHLIGAPVMATDLRASACLVIAGLCAQGETTINQIHHLDRGYEHIEEKLFALGARITRHAPPLDEKI